MFKMMGSIRSAPFTEGHPANDPAPAIPYKITALMQNEDFLPLLFEHLVDYGLHDCRRVCRTWYKASKQFPVQLKLATREGLRRINSSWNATSLKLVNRCEMTSDAKLFERLTSLTNLRSLAFNGGALSLDGSGQPYFQPMTGLTELSLESLCQDVTNDARASIKYLTNLTRLVLHCFSCTPSFHPLDELKNIRELDIDIYSFFNGHGACTFPSLTNLTYLKLTDQLPPEALLHPLTVRVLLIACFPNAQEVLFGRKSAASLPASGT